MRDTHNLFVLCSGISHLCFVIYQISIISTDQIKVKVKVSVYSPDIHVITHALQTLPPPAVGAQQPATIDPTLDLCTRHPLWLGESRQCGIRSLPNTSTHGQHWESNLRPSDLESNALSTWTHASK